MVIHQLGAFKWAPLFFALLLFGCNPPAQKLNATIFMAAGCPLCSVYKPVLDSIQSTYQSKIDLKIVLETAFYTQAEIDSFCKTYASWKITLDSGSIAQKYGATTTPEVFLKRGDELLYAGAIDDRMISLGEYRLGTITPYLRNAIDSSLSELELKLKTTIAVGCKIE